VVENFWLRLRCAVFIRGYNFVSLPAAGIRTYPKLIGPNRSYLEFQPAPLAVAGDVPAVVEIEVVLKFV
jgi:hypothetical protein